MKLTFKPSYATTNTVRFDEVTDGGFLSKPVIGALYITHDQLPALGLKLEAGDTYSEFGRDGREYKRQGVTGEGFTVTITKA